jgi:hypothetical protein
VSTPRWDPDERGRGIADAIALAPGVRELAGALTVEDWVAEEPEAHLLPHIQRACADAGLELLGHEVDGAVFVVRVAWTQERGPAEARAAAFAIVGSFAENATSVRVRDDNRTFEVVTGVLDGDSRFAPHGHMVRIELAPQG